MQKVWKLKFKIPQELADQYKDHHPLLAQLLYNRGLEDGPKIDAFLDPQYETGLNDPFLFKDMRKAVDRIWGAIEKDEKIFIYGDYDADAVTANAVLRHTFSYLNFQPVESYIPDRFAEGYGINLEALAKIKEQGAKVIITVDCGTNSVEAAQWCKQNGVDFIITDHHEMIGAAPDSFALINPKNKNDAYPDDQITGVGVAFKLAQAILKNPKSFRQNPKLKLGMEKWLLDLVATGTVADCHELLGENRIFVKYGLVVLPKTRWIGMRALMAASGLKGGAKPDTYTLGFVIAPRLNAAGRLEHANTALNLLLEENAVAAQEKARALESLNLKRRDTTSRILSEAREQALLIKDRKVLVMMNEGWHKGVVGLVAGRIAEEFYKPTVVLQQEGAQATGSARSVGGFNIVEALGHASDHLIRFGGHSQAAGLSLNPANFESFYRKILDYAEQNLQDESPFLELESEIKPEDLDLEIYNTIAQLEPFGVGNVKPKFLLKDANIISQKQVGAAGQHIQMQVKVGQKTVPGIAFNFKPLAFEGPWDVACELMADEWNGRKVLKLRIVDVKQSI